MTRYLILLALSLSPTLLSAQQQSGMEEFMYSSGKIYVVIAVVLIILGLLFFYLMRLDKKIKQLEDE